MKKRENLDYLIIFLIVVEVLMSAYLIYDAITDKGICGLEGCDIVKNSIYSQIFGVKLVYFALPAFLLLLGFFFLNKKIYIVGVTIGFVFALYLVFLQIFVIRAICTNCVIVDSTMILIFLLTFFDKRNRKHLKGLLGRRWYGS